MAGNNRVLKIYIKHMNVIIYHRYQPTKRPY